ncbi:hypothetical protein GN286_17495 [Rhodobacteraceae bacterium IMCC15231]|nr:hypothetical protein [Rhodobacteraceae bacterium IMCC15231]
MDTEKMNKDQLEEWQEYVISFSDPEIKMRAKSHRFMGSCSKLQWMRITLGRVSFRLNLSLKTLFLFSAPYLHSVADKENRNESSNSNRICSDFINVFRVRGELFRT